MMQAPRGSREGKGDDGSLRADDARTALSSGHLAPRRRPATLRRLMVAVLGLLFAGFFALGTWQVKRLQWKLDLIERVNQRVHAPALAAPGRERWPQVTAQSDEYRHVTVSGSFLPELSTRVQASTELGSGFWLLTPLCSADGSIVLINRGFVPAKAGDFSPRTTRPRASAEICAGAASAPRSAVTGLLRISEPGGGFLRKNDPAGEHWYSRDVQAIAAARGLLRVAPYFIDAEAAKGDANAAQNVSEQHPGDEQPVAGLTVITFHNSHLVYALTWYALALMVAGAGVWLVREERKPRPRAG
jgi:surfeit locus 1 family protein